MSWLQQLIGKLKSVFGRKSAQGEAALAPARTETGDSGGTEPAAVAAEEATETKAAVATEEKPAEDPVEATEATVEEPAEAPAVEADTPAVDAEKPAATPAVTSEVAAAEADVPAPAEPAEAATDATGETAEREATDPAISTLDVEGITAELQSEGPYGPGSSTPAAGGAAPSADFTVKGKESSKLYHTEKSPYFSRTKADVWFKSEADAESAGFQAWDHKKRAATKK